MTDFERLELRLHRWAIFLLMFGLTLSNVTACIVSWRLWDALAKLKGN